MSAFVGGSSTVHLRELRRCTCHVRDRLSRLQQAQLAPALWPFAESSPLLLQVSSGRTPSVAVASSRSGTSEAPAGDGDATRRPFRLRSDKRGIRSHKATPDAADGAALRLSDAKALQSHADEDDRISPRRREEKAPQLSSHAEPSSNDRKRRPRRKRTSNVTAATDGDVDGRGDGVARAEATKSADGAASSARQSANARRRAKMCALWADPQWRERALSCRTQRASVHRQARAMSKRWADSEYRSRTRESMRGRVAWNKDQCLSLETRRRMSAAQKGRTLSAVTRMRMSHAKLDMYKRRGGGAQEAPLRDDSAKTTAAQRWPEHLGGVEQLSRGDRRTHEETRHEYAALRNDLRLWSDAHRARTGRTPRAELIDSIALHAHLLTKLRRYLRLQAQLVEVDPSYGHDDPILR